MASNPWDPYPPHLDLTNKDIHVWRARFNCPEKLLRQFEATLAPEEIVRANRFVFQKDRNNFVAARGILRQLLGRYTSSSPEQIKFEYGPQGKPFVKSDMNKHSLDFNISHSHGMGLFAFAARRRLGVDIESIKPDFGGEEIAERYFSRHEVDELQSLPASLRAEGFFLCWTRKEAYIKAKGEGLSIPLKSFHVSLTPNKPERLQSADSTNWTLQSLLPDTGYAGALVYEGNKSLVRCIDWRSEV